MGFTEAVKTCLSKYIGFYGRAARPEYWWFALFFFAGAILLSLVDAVLWSGNTSPLAALFQLALFLPLLAAGWRRLQDTGRPGWYILLPAAVSIATMLVLLGGVYVFGRIEAGGADPDALRAPAGAFGMTGLAVAGLIQLAVTILMVWWLTRPGDAGPNAYGAPPQA